MIVMGKFYIYILTLLLVLVFLSGGLFYRDIVQGVNVETQTVDATNPCTPKGMEVIDIAQAKFTIKWETVSECSGYVVWGTAIDEANRMAISEDGLAKTTRHEVVVENLSPDSSYFLYIVSGDKIYGDKSGMAISVSTNRY